MPEFPDANSGGLDPSGAALTPVPVWRRVRVVAILIALYGAFVGMAAAGIWMLRQVFRPGDGFEDRGLHLVCAVGLLLPIGYVLRYFVRARLKTGTWKGNAEYRKQQRERNRQQCSTRGSSGPGKSGLIRYAVSWASCTAMDRGLPMPQRVGAWSVLVLYAAAVLAVIGIGVICFGAAFADDNTKTATALFIAMGIVVIAWPVTTVIRLVRGLRTGKVGATREEVEQIREQRAMQHRREWQKPLRSKIVSLIVSGVVVAFWWMRVTVGHARHPRESWVGPAIATMPLLYSVWMQFYKPKSVRAQKDDSGIPGN